MFLQIFKHIHSGARWWLLIFLVAAIVSAIIKLIKRKDYSVLNKQLSILTMSFAHIQLIVGLVLYFISNKVVFSAQSMSNHMLRFFLVEHLLMMLVAIVLITIGYSKIKRAQKSSLKHKRTLIFYGIALLIILVAIPWPWQIFGAGWL